MMRSTSDCVIITDKATTSSSFNKNVLGAWLEILKTTILSAGQHLMDRTKNVAL
jgi:hypothetical protein